MWFTVLGNSRLPITRYMGNNRLVINHEKTQLVVMGTKKFESKRGEVYVDTGGTKIFPSESAKLLGLNVHQSLKWGNHLITVKDPQYQTQWTKIYILYLQFQNKTHGSQCLFHVNPNTKHLYMVRN